MQMRKSKNLLSRSGIAESVTLALIALASTIITVVYEKESDRQLTKIIYMVDDNATIDKCIKVKK